MDGGKYRKKQNQGLQQRGSRLQGVRGEQQLRGREDRNGDGLEVREVRGRSLGAWHGGAEEGPCWWRRRAASGFVLRSRCRGEAAAGREPSEEAPAV